MNEINNNKRFQEVEKAVQGGQEPAKVDTAEANLLETAKICPQCQQKVAAGSRFCNQCGYAFPVAEQATAAAETTRETDSEKTTEAQQ